MGFVRLDLTGHRPVARIPWKRGSSNPRAPNPFPGPQPVVNKGSQGSGVAAVAVHVNGPGHVDTFGSKSERLVEAEPDR